MGSNLFQGITFVHKQLITTYTFTVLTHFNRQITLLLLSLQCNQHYNIIMHIMLTTTYKFCTIVTTFNVSFFCPLCFSASFKKCWCQHPENEIIISTHIWAMWQILLSINHKWGLAGVHFKTLTQKFCFLFSSNCLMAAQLFFFSLSWCLVRDLNYGPWPVTALYLRYRNSHFTADYANYVSKFESKHIKNLAVFVHMVAQIFVTTVEWRIMTDKDSFMSFRRDLLIVLYRHIFFLQVVIHNTIQAKTVYTLTFIM